MTIDRHNLASELPEHRDAIHALKLSDHHFARQLDAYQELNKRIHHFESGAEACTDSHLEGLKKERLALKDALWERLTSG